MLMISISKKPKMLYRINSVAQQAEFFPKPGFNKDDFSFVELLPLRLICSVLEYLKKRKWKSRDIFQFLKALA